MNPLHRDLFEYKNLKYKQNQYENQTNQTILCKNISNGTIPYEIEKQLLCVITYSPLMQNYNTVILFFHLIDPFIVNLCSALCIIIESARRRSTIRTNQTTRKYAVEHLNEHSIIPSSDHFIDILAVSMHLTILGYFFLVILFH